MHTEEYSSNNLCDDFWLSDPAEEEGKQLSSQDNNTWAVCQ